MRLMEPQNQSNWFNSYYSSSNNKYYKSTEFNNSNRNNGLKPMKKSYHQPLQPESLLNKSKKKKRIFSLQDSISNGGVGVGSNSVRDDESQLLHWLECELENRGIDPMVYGRYVLSLLQYNSDQSGGDCEVDSGYGSITAKRNVSRPLSSSSSATVPSRYCEAHHRLYPPFNQTSYRSKENTQKAPSTTKWMHRRYLRNNSPNSKHGSSSDDSGELRTNFEEEDNFDRNCPECVRNRGPGDQRKQSVLDCLKNATDQKIGIDSFVDQLCAKFDTFRQEQLEKESTTSSKFLQPYSLIEPDRTFLGKSKSITSDLDSKDESLMFSRNSEYRKFANQHHSTGKYHPSDKVFADNNLDSQKSTRRAQSNQCRSYGDSGGRDMSEERANSSHKPQNGFRDQALKYYAAFPALSVNNNNKSSSSSSTSSSSVAQSKASKIISQQSSIEDSVFGDTIPSTPVRPITSPGKLADENRSRSWNGKKIINTIVNSNNRKKTSSLATTSHESHQPHQQQSSMESKFIKPLSASIGGLVKCRPTPIVAPLANTTDTSSSFTVLKKKTTSQTAPQQSSSNSSSASEEKKANSGKAKPIETSSSQVNSKELEKILNLMPSFLNPMKSNSTTTAESKPTSVHSTADKCNEKSIMSPKCLANVDSDSQTNGRRRGGGGRINFVSLVEAKPPSPPLVSIKTNQSVANDCNSKTTTNESSSTTFASSAKIFSSRSSIVDLLPDFLRQQQQEEERKNSEEQKVVRNEEQQKSTASDAATGGGGGHKSPDSGMQVDKQIMSTTMDDGNRIGESLFQSLSSFIADCDCDLPTKSLDNHRSLFNGNGIDSKLDLTSETLDWNLLDSKITDYDNKRDLSNIDFITYFWNKNSTIGYMDFLYNNPVEESKREPNEVKKCYERFVEEQRLLEEEISLMSELYLRSATNASRDEAVAHVSLSNHESQHSAFEEVNNCGADHCSSSSIVEKPSDEPTLSDKASEPFVMSHFQPILQSTESSTDNLFSDLDSKRDQQQCSKANNVMNCSWHSLFNSNSLTSYQSSSCCSSRDSLSAGGGGGGGNLSENFKSLQEMFEPKSTNCGCKVNCNGHLTQSACCCFPDEYHCRSDVASFTTAEHKSDKSTCTENQLDNNKLWTQNFNLQFVDSEKNDADDDPLDEDDFNVDDLINDVLRLTICDGGSDEPKFFGSKEENEAKEEDALDYDSIPMPYSKRNKLKNAIFGKFSPVEKRQANNQEKSGAPFENYEEGASYVYESDLNENAELYLGEENFYQDSENYYYNYESQQQHQPQQQQQYYGEEGDEVQLEKYGNNLYNLNGFLINIAPDDDDTADLGKFIELKSDSLLQDASCESKSKPCTFYMEGICARGDCKFSHDLSSITCKYWEEGFCFKENLCPFRHGYPEKKSVGNSSKLDPNAKSFQFKIESDSDFPSLFNDGCEESKDHSSSTSIFNKTAFFSSTGAVNFDLKASLAPRPNTTTTTDADSNYAQQFRRTSKMDPLFGLKTIKEPEDEWPSLSVSSGNNNDAKIVGAGNLRGKLLKKSMARNNSGGKINLKI